MPTASDGAGRAITGATRLAGVIGSPVRHSRSPAIFDAAFGAAGLDWRYLAFEVADGRAADAVAAMEVLGIEGLSVTMPHKTAIARALRRRTASATALDAVNCVFRDGDALVGDNTDGEGFVAGLAAEGIDVEGRRVLVVGAGGAARAVVRAVVDHGAVDVAVWNRTESTARAAAALAGDVGRVAVAGDLGTADLVVQATPVGMGTDPTLAFDVDACADGAVVSDLVYHPLETPVLAAAAARGLPTVGGLPMLVHQAAAQFRRWTGREPDITAMTVAAEGATADKTT